MKSFSASYLHTLLRGLAICSSFFLFTTSAKAQSQVKCSQEAPINTFAYAPGSKVYYDINLPNTPTGTGAGAGTSPSSQIAQATQAWNTANASTGDNTQFLPADAINPATLHFMDSTEAGMPASQTVSPLGSVSANATVTITFYVSAKTPSGAQAFSSTQAGYGGVFLMAALHELGHMMGFGDYLPNTVPDNPAPEPPPGTSVMNNEYGTNNTGTPTPLIAPTPCDAAGAAINSAVLNQPVSNSGGGDGHPPIHVVPVNGAGGSGGSGNAPSSCSYYYFYDEENNTIYAYETCTA